MRSVTRCRFHITSISFPLLLKSLQQFLSFQLLAVQHRYEVEDYEFSQLRDELDSRMVMLYNSKKLSDEYILSSRN